MTLYLIAHLTFIRRADRATTVPAVWGFNDPPNRMMGSVVGDIRVTSAGAPPELPFRISMDGAKWSARVDFGTKIKTPHSQLRTILRGPPHLGKFSRLYEEPAMV